MTAKKKKAKSKTSTSDKTLLLLAGALVISIGAYLYLSGKSSLNSSRSSSVMQKTATVALNTQNKSGEAGTATLTEVGGKVQVKLTLAGTPKGVPQPAHIHVGSCPNPGDIKYPLSSVVDGKSETTIDTSFDSLMKSLPLSINIHKSVPQVKVYVACGNLTVPQY